MHRSETKRAFSLEWRREDHAGGGTAIGQKLLDEVFKFCHGGEDQFEQEGVVAGEVVALLHGVERRKELEEGFVARAFAGEAHEGRDRKAEGLHVDVGAVTADELETLEAPEALGGGRGGKSDAPSELRYGEARVGREFPQNFAVNLVDAIVEKHGGSWDSFELVSNWCPLSR